MPGIAANARAVAALCPDEGTAALVLAGNACQVYNLKLDDNPGGEVNAGEAAR